MAGKTVKMSKLKQLLQWKLNGCSNRKIAEAIGINKETVNLYVNRAKADPLGMEGLLKLDEAELDNRLRGGNAAYTDARFETFKRLLPYFVEQMNRPHAHMTLLQLWTEYKAEHPDGYELTQFRYHYRQNTLASKTPTTVLADMHVPGEKLYMDFTGDKLSYVDVSTGEVVQTQTFVACLPYSNYAYALCVPSQREEDFVHALIQCLRHLGGVPKILVPDNLKSAVIKSDNYAPHLNQLLEDIANHYGAVVLPARVRHPKDKSNVEGLVRIVYNRIYAPLRNQTFYSLNELNAAVAEQLRQHNQKRMSIKPYSREEQFLAAEKPALKPLPATDFEVRYRTSLKVQNNGCIYLGRDKHFYSVPYPYIGRQVDVDYTRSIVKVYADGQCIATHKREIGHGLYTLVNEHLASHSQAWRSRSREYYVERALPIMEELATLINYMFLAGGQPEEVYYRSCDGLLHLCRNTDPVIFREACETALHMKRYSYRFVKNVIAQKTAGLAMVGPMLKAPGGHENIRGAEAFR